MSEKFNQQIEWTKRSVFAGTVNPLTLVVAEMDRRGKVIEDLEARISELEAEIARTKPYDPSWDNPDGPTAA